jgi:hypothetical protein
MTIRIASGLSLPLDCVTQTFGAIGRKGAGKTYLATMMAEQMLDAGAQVVCLDVVGNWWGLRVGADGKSKGKEIFVLGGDHGDVPIAPESGPRLAKLIVEKNISAVLDISSFRIHERKRFAWEFAEELLHLKKKQRTAMHLFVEEAQLLIPERVGHDEARMVGAYEHIVRLGRNYGIGCTLVTQRPQSVNKNALNQVECLFVLQVTGPHERKALEGWVQEAGADRSLVGELPSLGRGEGYVWSPAWLRVYKRVQFAKKQTFDASATPEVGKAARAASLSSVDVEALRSDLAEMIEKAKAEDPRELRKRIAVLEGELRKAKSAPVPATISEEDILQIRRAATGEVTKKLLSNVQEAGEKIQRIVDEIVAGVGHAGIMNPIKVTTGKSRIPLEKHRAPEPRRVTGNPHRPSDEKISSSQQRILDSLAWLESVGIASASKTQVALLADQSPTSGGYFNNLGRLRSFEMISYPSPSVVALTETGRGSARQGDIPTTSEELHAQLYRKLSGSQNAILRNVIAAYPDDMAKSDLAEKAGQSPTSGGYFNNLGRLRSLGLIDYPAPGRVVANRVLFLEG